MREGAVILLVLVSSATVAYTLGVLTEPDATRWSGSTATEWIARLRSPAPESRDSAIVALAALEPGARRTLAAAAVLLADSSEDVANDAMDALLVVRDRERNALHMVLELTTQTLKAQGSIGRTKAARVLGAIGRPAVPAVADLVQTMSDTNASVRAAIAAAIGSILEGAGKRVDTRVVATATATLSAALRDPSPLVRDAAIESLFRIVPDDPRLPVLFQAARYDSSADVRERANVTMTWIERRKGHFPR
jgi:HEAT repeat protein